MLKKSAGDEAAILRAVLRGKTESALLVAYCILAVAPFAYAATRSEFWEPEHSMAPVATLIYLVVVTALVVGRRRWAWFLLALLYAAGVIGWIFDPRRFRAKTIVFEAIAVATLALMVSPPLRHRLRRPVRLGIHRERPAER